MAREIYYLIESISTATDRNQNFAGETHLYYHGKGDELLFAETGTAYADTNLLTPYHIREYGYKRECDARRNWSYNNPENSKYWQTETRIVRAWVRKDNQVFIG
jgi:hypothetical protein